MNFPGKLTIPPDVLLQEVGEEVVLLNLRNGTYYGLNPVGAAMLRGIRDGRDLEEVRETILNDFEVAVEELGRDMAELIDQMLACRLLCIEKD